MNTVLPDFLDDGATIGIIVPGSACSRKPYDQGIAYLRNKGFRVILPEKAKRGRFYLAAPDSSRTRMVQEMITNPKVDAVFCARGGYGVLRILDRLNYDSIAKHPKPIIGYSDITALSLALYAKLGWISFSGPMICSEMGKGIDPYTEEWLWKMLYPHSYPVQLRNPSDQPLQVFRQGEAEGPIIAGCLSLISPLLGTPYQPDFSGAILIIEDIDEKGHRLDRLLLHLKLAGVFEQISGLVLGQFVKCFPKNKERGFTLEELLHDIIGSYRFPVITNLAYGHVPRRLTLPIGSIAQMSTDPPQLSIIG